MTAPVYQPTHIRAETLILGLGNILLQDEGVGVRVIEAMREIPLPAGIELLDGGTASQDMIFALAGRCVLIVIDAVQADQEPGAIFRFNPRDLSLNHDASLSVHQMGFLEALHMAELVPHGAPQQVVMYGIQPDKLGWGLELSPAVADAVPRVVGLIRNEIETLNAPASAMKNIVP